eukprot:TRINITY_DN100647_c0_g1_i1.p1 TRINITY_DN100647_c0_g1~~TRINITY_DN100647_c0_g1_i1.p1  ORF type:complete len:346 (+),score=50.21 TRINITY_DN100647_c0_g1_i1:48-1085(+)
MSLLLRGGMLTPSIAARDCSAAGLRVFRGPDAAAQRRRMHGGLAAPPLPPARSPAGSSGSSRGSTALLFLAAVTPLGRRGVACCQRPAPPVGPGRASSRLLPVAPRRWLADPRTPGSLCISRRCASSGVDVSAPDGTDAVMEFFSFIASQRGILAAADGAMSAELRASIEQKLADVEWAGLAADPRTLSSMREDIGYQDVYSSADVTLCIFYLKKGARIPLHDHPSMHVFGKLLFGKLRVISLDVVGAAGSDKMTAHFHSDQEYGPEPVTFCLGPEAGNLHELYAVEDCAFFDLVTPSYNSRSGRDCTYYGVVEMKKDGTCTIQPRYPRNFYMDSVPYRGPPFID